MTRQIAVISDDPGWHGARLTEALVSKGCACRYVRLQDCKFTITEGLERPLKIAGFEDLPDAVFVRGIPGGSLEQVIFYLDILHACEHLGIRVYNNVRSIERSVDKAMTSFVLHDAGIPTPPTHVVSDVHAAYAQLRLGLQQEKRFVVKPLFGSQGKGLILVETQQDLHALDHYYGVYYLQEFISPGTEQNQDWRLFVIGDQLVATMSRHATGWISNVAHGAVCRSAQLPAAVGEMAIRASQLLGLDYAGVDIMMDQSGRYVVTEVNSVPAWKGLQSVVDFDVAESIASHFLSLLDRDGQTVAA